MKKTLFSLLSVWAIVLLFLTFLTGCNKEASQSPLPAPGNAKDAINAKMSITVHAGESIQAAVDAAAPGTTIKIEPGTYTESVTVNKAGIKLVGMGDDEADVVIQNPDEEENGIIVFDAGDGFVLKNVTIKNFEENGVILIRVDNFILSHVTTIDNGEYGLFPVFSSHGIIDHCTASGHSDTGIYVGQSTDVKMQYNTAHDNVNGLEIENSSDIDASFNKSYNNVCGILVTLLPGLDVKTSSNIHVAYNLVIKNNHENFGDTTEGLESAVPPGLGILVLGTDHTTVEHNIAAGNKFAGITLFSSLVLVELAGLDPNDFDIEPNPDGTSITQNIVEGNGFNPPPLDIPLPGVDLLWDGSGNDNCWSGNKFKTAYPAPLPSCN